MEILTNKIDDFLINKYGDVLPVIGCRAVLIGGAIVDEEDVPEIFEPGEACAKDLTDEQIETVKAMLENQQARDAIAAENKAQREAAKEIEAKRAKMKQLMSAADLFVSLGTMPDVALQNDGRYIITKRSKPCPKQIKQAHDLRREADALAQELNLRIKWRW